MLCLYAMNNIEKLSKSCNFAAEMSHCVRFIH